MEVLLNQLKFGNPKRQTLQCTHLSLLDLTSMSKGLCSFCVEHFVWWVSGESEQRN